MDMKLSERAAAAFTAAISSKGPNMGRLKRSAPPSNTDGYYAWHAAMLSVNPHKASIGAHIMANAEQRAIMTEVTDALDAMPKGKRIELDADRAGLERMGVW